LNKENPLKFKEDVSGSNVFLYKQKEMKVLHINKTWKLVKLSKGWKTIGYKWVYKIKENYQIYTWKRDINFNEIFSQVVRLTIIRVIWLCVLQLNILSLNNCTCYNNSFSISLIKHTEFK